MAQRDTNPFKNSDTNKRYYTYDYYLKKTFGGKCAKIPLDAGLSCPNKDGTCGVGGCIYCLSGSSSSVGDTLEAQYRFALETANRKWTPVGYIPYFQAGSNTYADAKILREMYNRAAELPQTVMLDIATRADCLSDCAVEEIVKLSEKIPVTVELGLQSSNDETARTINRGHDMYSFVKGYEKLRSAGGNIKIGVHIINGLPRESYEDMMNTARDVSKLGCDLVKIHLMMVLRGTELERMYLNGEYTPIEREFYVKTVCDQLEVLSPDTVIGRITGDSPAEFLIEPQWCRRKTEIANMIDKELYRRESYQGKFYCEGGGNYE